MARLCFCWRSKISSTLPNGKWPRLGMINRQVKYYLGVGTVLKTFVMIITDTKWSYACLLSQT